MLGDLGYTLVPADVVLDDWDPERGSAEIAADAVQGCAMVGDGAIVLLHTWPPQALEAVPEIVDSLRAAGASFIDVSALPPSRWTTPSPVAGGIAE